MCGEKLTTLGCCGRLFGSPPRARGEAVPGRAPAPGLGITPACAGRRLHQSRELFGDQDHPRVRGEKECPKNAPKDTKGSPPRARGEEKDPKRIVL